MDAIFKALNDSSRRRLLDALRDKDGQTLTELETRVPELSRFGVMKHLKGLEEANLITTKRAGRFKHHFLNAAPLQEVIDRWIEPFLAKPAARGLLDFKSQLETDTMTPDLVLSTYIRTTRDALWDALTRADHVAAYHFASSNVTGDQAPGQTQSIHGDDGTVILEMRTLSIDPKTRLEVAFQPYWAPNVPESRVVYVLADSGDNMRLTVEHYGVPVGQDGISDGWTRLMSGLKTWLETGDTARFEMVAPLPENA